MSNFSILSEAIKVGSDALFRFNMYRDLTGFTLSLNIATYDPQGPGSHLANVPATIDPNDSSKALATLDSSVTEQMEPGHSYMFDIAFSDGAGGDFISQNTFVVKVIPAVAAS